MAISSFFLLAHQVADGEHLHVEEQLMASLRTDEPVRPAGPPWLVRVARDVTALGSVMVLTLLTVLIVGFLSMTRRFGAALFLIAASAGGQSLNGALKIFYGRERPDAAYRWTEIDSPSFPSGHATGATVVYLTLAVLLARLTHTTRERAYIIGAALLLSFLIGLSRVYLGVHYPSDVIAGWTVGIAWAQVCWIAARALGRRKLAQPS